MWESRLQRKAPSVRTPAFRVEWLTVRSRAHPAAVASQVAREHDKWIMGPSVPSVLPPPRYMTESNSLAE
eukprot:6468433-Amphidinium_carterae.2